MTIIDMVKQLVGDDGFAKEFVREEYFDYSQRWWFLLRLASYHVSPSGNPVLDPTYGIPQDRQQEIKNLIRGDLVYAKQVIEARRDRRDGPTGFLWRAGNRTTIIAQIVYGAIAVHPKVFSGGANREYLDFIVGRRLRAVRRLLHDVMPASDSGSTSFVYGTGANRGMLNYQVNAAVKLYWVGLSAGGKFPFELDPGGREFVVEAIEGLFKPWRNSDKRNRVGCETAAMIVHVDSLLAAHEPEQFLKHLSDKAKSVEVTTANGQVLEIRVPYLTIDAVNNPMRALDGIHMGEISIPVHLTSDPGKLPPNYEDEALFENVLLKPVDLQVGDQLYLQNHPVYGVLDPEGVWAGEFCFVTRFKKRDPADTSGATPKTDWSNVVITGHGASGNVEEVVEDHMLGGTNKLLELVCIVVKENLDSLQMEPDPPCVPDHVRQSVADAIREAMRKTFQAQPGSTFSHAFQGEIRFVNHSATKFFVFMLDGTLNGESVGCRDHFFVLNTRLRDLSSFQWPDQIPVTCPLIHVKKVGDYPVQQCNYEMYYTVEDPVTPKKEVKPFALFHRPNDGFGRTPGSRRRIRHTDDDIRDRLFSTHYRDLQPEDGKIHVRRPRVSEAPDYLEYLRNNGAIE